jgi:hypothetical protein
VVVVGGGEVVVVVGGGGGVVVGGVVGGGLVGGGLVGGGLFGAGLFGAGLFGAGFGAAGDDLCCIVVEVEEVEFDPDGDVVGTVPELFVVVRSSVPFVWTVNHALAKPCPAACDREWSPWKK